MMLKLFNQNGIMITTTNHFLLYVTDFCVMSNLKLLRFQLSIHCILLEDL